MLELPLLLIVIVGAALVFDYTNGANDTGNVIATVIATRALTPKQAVVMAAVFNFIGALMGTAVAMTVVSGIVNIEKISPGSGDVTALAGCKFLVLAAVLGAIAWNVLTWLLGLPSSSSHALVGGLIGAGIAYGGFGMLKVGSIMTKVVVPIFASPLAGLLVGYGATLGLTWLSVRARPRPANRLFRRLQIFSSSVMAFSHGMNDAQKTMGLIALALYIFGRNPELAVPLWVKLACATVMVLGTVTGGWRIVKTLGSKFFRMEPIHGFAIQTASALVIEGATHFGAPISTTHVISSAVLGAGSVRSLSAVRWKVAGRMVTAWFLTLPAAALVGALMFWLLTALFI
ncbi:MAG TPA: inorganic phosphate transporter [bacterium]|nr:inorganic phosphate transporter [bacterium]